MKKYAHLGLSGLLFAVLGVLMVSPNAQALSTVVVASNQTDGNILMTYALSSGGTLTPRYSFPTGGIGTGGGLGNQSGIAANNNWLLVVNAGSDDISLFRTQSRGELSFRDKASSNGVRPVSVDIHNRLVYVLNVGDENSPSNITGFTIEGNGQLQMIPGSTTPVSADLTGAAQVAFSPNGQNLAVTEKATNTIVTFSVDAATGLLSNTVVNTSNGQTPFGFQWADNNTLIVSEAFGGTDSAVSEYDIENDGSLTSISPSVDAGDERAACWIALVPRTRLVLTTNTATGSISSYERANNGGLTLLDSQAALTGMGPIDLAVDHNGRAGAVLNAGDDSIQSFTISRSTGALVIKNTIAGIPDGSNGMVIVRR
ncbi:MAG: beta-propeller fold lactonase family protein [Bdellovibrionales bacterium]|nr:beta-propeller fold lactonase family protein [Bdellovibrionales bacterium]